MLRKLLQWRRRRRVDAAALYGAIVAQARQPVFHAGLGVPDTVMWRFQLLALHVILVVDRLLDVAPNDAEAATCRELARQVQERLFDEMDAYLREVGVGDPAVPKRMEKLVSLFYGQMKRYRAALREEDAEALREALRRNIFVDTDERTARHGAAVLAGYMLQARAALVQTASCSLEKGIIAWPQPPAGREGNTS